MKYTGAQLQEISFPLGGIGTGSIGLAGNGRLVDWEIFNRPNKGGGNGYSFFAVRAKTADGAVHPRALCGDLTKDLTGTYRKGCFGGFGLGPSGSTMAGFPHFGTCTFDGRFPVAQIDFSDPEFPGTVTLTALNPMIPLNPDDSSLPAAMFDLCFRNPTDAPMTYTGALTLQSPFESSVNRDASDASGALLHCCDGGHTPDDPAYGDLTVACLDANAAVQPNWYRGRWQDGIVMFWNEFASGAPLHHRAYPTPGKRDCGVVSADCIVPPGGSAHLRFVLSWNFPNNYNYWNPLKDDQGRDVTWKNYYATMFADSAATARYIRANWDRLTAQTMDFRDVLHGASLDPAVIDAASATLSVLKSPTVLRLTDGSFYGWEGVHETAGSCEGTCMHVWNYAYALCFLFPSLERSIRDLEFRYSMYPSGGLCFRLKLPVGRDPGDFRPCVDGQMGSIIKTYREWKLSGDNDWLRSVWPSVQRAMQYAWSDRNPDEWDRNRDGVLEGRQHHTLDMELFGPSSWLEGFYLAALKAAAEMADFLGDASAAAEYRDIFARGASWTKAHLFNGAYFIQQLDLRDRTPVDHFGCPEYWNDEAGQLKYQIGDGCEIDQMVAQWHADLCGLGDIFDPAQVDGALDAMFRHNFKPSMRNFTNPWRLFALNDEAGAIICDYPAGTEKPAIPIPYCEESMHGFEYAFAGLLIARGRIDEGLTVVRAVRSRYNGANRNPWNEIECGSNYARSMASFALLPLLSGFRYDAPRGAIAFDPKVCRGAFRCLWSVGSGWGEFIWSGNSVQIVLHGGTLSVSRITLPFAAGIESVTIDDAAAPFTFTAPTLHFSNPQTIHQTLTITLPEQPTTN